MRLLKLITSAFMAVLSSYATAVCLWSMDRTEADVRLLLLAFAVVCVCSTVLWIATFEQTRKERSRRGR